MNPSNRKGNSTGDCETSINPSPQAVGESYLGTLTAKDFDALERYFSTQGPFPWSGSLK